MGSLSSCTSKLLKQGIRIDAADLKAIKVSSAQYAQDNPTAVEKAASLAAADQLEIAMQDYTELVKTVRATHPEIVAKRFGKVPAPPVVAPATAAVSAIAEQLNSTPPTPTAKDVQNVVVDAVKGTSTAVPEAPKTTPAQNTKKAEQLYVSSIINLISGRANEVDPALIPVIESDPSYAQIKAEFASGKSMTAARAEEIIKETSGRITLQAAQAQALEAAQTQNLQALTTSKTLRKADPVKTEAQRVLKEVRALLSGTKDEKNIGKLTLGQATALLETNGGLNAPPVEPIKKARKSAKKIDAPKPTPVAEEPKKAVLKKADKPAPKVEETPPPKQEAPAKVGAAQDVSEASNKDKPKRSTLRLPASIDALAKLALKDVDVPNTVKQDITEAIKLAQESGDAAQLNDLIKENEINSKTAKDLRMLAQEKTKPAAVLEKEQIEATIKEAKENDLEDLQHLGENYLLRNEVDGDLPSSVTDGKVEAILQALEDGTYTVEDAVSDVQEIEATAPIKTIGLERILARLKRARVGADAAELKALDFAEWLLGKSPHLANRMAITIRDMGKKGPAGNYDPVADLIYINASGYSPRTIVHEILHRAERMMPKSLQNKVRAEYFARLNNKYKQAIANNDQPLIDLIDSIYAWNVDKSAETRQAMRELLMQGAIDKTIDADNMYKYTEPSEYWAETASEILTRRHKTSDHWGYQLKEWYAEFTENVKKLFGKDNNAAVYKGLREVLSSDGSQQSDVMLSKREGTFNSEEFGAEVPDEENIFLKTNAEAKAEDTAKKDAMAEKKAGTLVNNKPRRAMERLANNVMVFEELDIEVRKRKLISTFKTSLAEAHRIYNGMISRYSSIDNEQVAIPVRDWINDNYERFGTSFDNATDNINAFFGAQNIIERLKTAYLFEVALPVEADLVREGILSDIYEGVDSAAEAKAKGRELRRLVEKYAETSLEEHAGDIYLEQLGVLNQQKQNGLTEAAMQPLNKLSDPIRKRMRERMEQSGQVAKDDYVIDFYGWDWYVPQKAPTFKDHTQSANAAFDFASSRPTTKGLHKEVLAMQENAKEYIGFKPLDRLLVDLDRSAERAAYKGLTDSAFQLIVDNTDEDGNNPFKAVIEKWTGTPYKGYKDANGNYVANLSHPKVGFIRHNGNTHYRVTLPDNSDMGRGFLAMTAVLKPNEFVAAIGKGTNTLARAYTTASPTWQTAKGFMRELTALPITVAAEQFKNPLDALPLMGAFYKNMLGAYDSVKHLAPTVLDGKSKFGTTFEEGASVKDSVAYWTKLYRDNGGSMDVNQVFEGGKRGVWRPPLGAKISNIQDSTLGLKARTLDGLDVLVAPLELVNKYTSNYAQFLETVPRAMMFKSLVEVEGLSYQEAAVRVRSVMDYAQTGLWSRNMNAVWAFSKTSLTGVDTMRRVFRDKKTGETDYQKIGAWSVAMSGLSASAYFLIKALMGVDDDGVPRMHKISAEGLTQRMYIPSGTTDSRPIVVELGLGLPQMLLAPGVLMAAAADGHITPDEAVTEMANTIQRNGPIKVVGQGDRNPSDIVGNFGMALIPTVLQPNAVIATNKSVFGTPIHTTVDKPDTPDWQEGRASTSPVYKDIAEWLYKNTNGKVEYYPEDIRSLMINYGGQNARDVLAAAVDNPAKENIGYKVDNPLTGRFRSNEAEYYANTRVRKAMNSATDVIQNVNTVRNEVRDQNGTEGQKKAAARKYLAAHPDEAKIYAAYKALQKAQDSYNDDIRTLSRDKMTSVTRKQFKRKELDAAMREKVIALEQAMDDL